MERCVLLCRGYTGRDARLILLAGKELCEGIAVAMPFVFKMSIMIFSFSKGWLFKHEETFHPLDPSMA
jgi:hypothetical protein